MKISFFLPSLNVGGIERVFITYANSIAKENDVDFVLCKREGVLLKEVSTSVNIVDLGNVSLPHCILPLRNYLKSNNRDCVITGGDYPNICLIVASRLLRNKPKIIISQHNYFNIEVKELGFIAKLTPFWLKTLYPYADCCVAVSNGIYRFLTKDIKLNESKIVYLPNPIDLDDIDLKSSLESEFNLPKKYITFIGRISSVKNLKLLLDAFDIAELNDSMLLIVGSGADEQNLKTYSQSLNKSSKILFTGATNNPLPIIKHAQALVLPSFSEAFPTILLESLALNTPIIATPTKGAKEVLKGVEGAFISNSFTDKEELAHLLEKSILPHTQNLKENVIKYEKRIIIKQFLSLCKS